MYSTGLREKSEKGFARARREALVKGLLGRLAAGVRGARVCCELLACFEAVRAGSGAVRGGRKKVETVEVAKISGSVGRCLDFDRNFLPANRSLEGRWRNVDRAFAERRLAATGGVVQAGRRVFRPRRQPSRVGRALSGCGGGGCGGDGVRRGVWMLAGLT